MDLKLFAIVLLCTVTLIKCVQEEERKPFDKYIFQNKEKQEEILKKCYSIVVKWREGYTLNDSLSRIMSMDHSQWSDFDKLDLVKYNREFNEEFVKERCDEIFVTHLKPFEIEEDSETNNPVEETSLPTISKSKAKAKGESKKKKIKNAALKSARFMKRGVEIVGGQLLFTPACLIFIKIPQVVTRPLWGVIRAKIFNDKISEEVVKEIKKIPKIYFNGLSDCVKKGPAFKVYKKRQLLKKKREKQERKNQMNQFF